MFKTVVTVLVSLAVTAGAALGLDIDQSKLINDLDAQVGQSLQVETMTKLDGFGLSSSMEGSAAAEAGIDPSSDHQRDTKRNIRGDSEAEGSTQAETQLDLQKLAQLWNRIFIRLEQAAEYLKNKVGEIEFDVSLQTEGKGTLDTGVGGDASGKAERGSSGSGDGSASIGGEGSSEGTFRLPSLDADAVGEMKGGISGLTDGSISAEGEILEDVFSLPFLDGFLSVENETNAEAEVDAPGQ